MLHLLDSILSFTKWPNSLFPIILCWHRSSFTFSGITTFVTRLKMSLLPSKNGFVKLLMLQINYSIFFSWSDCAALIRLWWCVSVLEEVPAICLTCSASLASSGAIRKYLVRALGLSMMPTSPPETFIDLLARSRALSAPIAQNDTEEFLFTTQFPF